MENEPIPNALAGVADTPVSTSLEDVKREVLKHYRPELWQALKTALAVVASLSLKSRDHCLVLVLEGGSGQGKSVILRSVSPDRPQTKAVLERVDDFTPASFVSHASNRTPKELATIDLLPKLKGKVMLTKELAPLFRDSEKELRKSFARLTSVLDGDGYKTHSGTQGERGYTGRYIFNWLGATTPIPETTHKIMAQLGNRILFYEIAGEQPTEKDLLEFAKNYGANDSVMDCRATVNDFVEGYFQSCPVESVEPDSVRISDDLYLEIIRYAQLIAEGRVEVNFDDAGDPIVGRPEGPHRVVLLLGTLARGLGLVESRFQVISDDLEVIRHVAMSCLPQKRRELLRALIAGGGVLNSGQVETTLSVSKPTALKRMRELDATGLCLYTPGNNKASAPATIRLTTKWQWLLLSTATPPLKKPGVCGLGEAGRSRGRGRQTPEISLRGGDGECIITENDSPHSPGPGLVSGEMEWLRQHGQI